MSEEDGKVVIGVEIKTEEIEPNIQKLQEKLVKQNETLDRQKIAVERLTARYEQLYNKAKMTSTPNIESDKILIEISKLEQEYNKLVEKYKQAKLEPSIDEAKIEEILNKASQIKGKIIELKKEFEFVQFSPEMQNKLKLLGQQIDIAIQKENRLTGEVKATEQEIDNLSKKRIDELQDNVNKITNHFKNLGKIIHETQEQVINYLKNGLSSAFSSVGEKISSVGKRILNLGASAFVFNVISSGFRQLSNGIQNLISRDNELNRSLEQIKINLVTAFYPIYRAVLPAIRSLGEAIEWITGKIASLVALLTGTEISENQKRAQEITFGTGALNKQAKSYDKLGKEAKKARGQLASFDKIEVLQNKHHAKAGAGQAGGISGVGGLAKQIKSLNSTPIENIIKKIKELGETFRKGFKTGNVDKNFNEIIDSANRCKKVIQDVFNDPDVAKGFNDTLNTIVFNLGKVVGSMASVGTTIGRLLVGGIAGFLEQSQGVIKENLLREFDITQELYNFIGEYAKAFANIFEIFASPQAQNSLSNMLTGWYALFSSFYLNVSDICVSITKAILSPFVNHQEEIKEALGNTLKAVEKFTNGVKDIFSALGQTMTNITQKTIKPAIQIIGKIWNDVFGMIIKAWETYINPMLNRVGDKFQKVVNEHIKPAIERVGTAFNKIFSKIKPLIEKTWEILKPFVNWVINNFLDLIATKLEIMFDITSYVIVGICEHITNLWETAEKVISQIVNLINRDWKQAWKGAGEVVEGMKKICENAIRAVGRVIIGMIETLLKGLNVAIRALNRIHIDLPDWLGGGHFGVNIPEIPKNWGNIPKLSKGAVLEGGSPFLAWINDQPKGQTNIETPLSTMIEAFKQAGATSNPNIIIEANGDFAEFIRLLNFKLKEEDARIGQSFVSGDVWV